jgi:hypothetical protein
MKRFRDYRLWIKQAIIFGVLLVLMAGVGIFLMYRMTFLKSEIDTITSTWLPSAVASASFKSSASDLRNVQLQHAIAQNDSTKRRLMSVMVELIDRIEMNREEYLTLINAPEQLEIYERFEDKWERYQDLSFDFFALDREDRQEQAIVLLTGAGEVAFNDYNAVLDTLVSTNGTASSDAA